jgi:PhzF family phenazine biosynthesis protein
LARRPFKQVDVFTTTPYLGNPVAVVLDGDGLSTTQMHGFARWTNLSETTFVLPPSQGEADYHVRIFTSAAGTETASGLSAELPFAGHPTLGTCHAWLEASGMPRRGDVIVQQCGAGLVEIRRTGDGLSFAAPPLIRSGEVEESLVMHIASTLGIGRDQIVDAAWVDNGPGWVGLLLDSADAVLALQPGFVDQEVGVIGPYPAGEAAFEVRGFFPKDAATAEDPVTGSLNASLAQWLLATRRASAPYVASQGTALGRSGRVHITQEEDGTVWVGGGTVTCIEGEVEL